MVVGAVVVCWVDARSGQVPGLPSGWVDTPTTP